MRVESAKQLRVALELQPNAKGLAKLRTELEAELGEASGESVGPLRT
jgi:hypothetical protein